MTTPAQAQFLQPNGLALVEAPAAIFERPVLHIVGVRNGGKTTIIRELESIGHYACVPYLAAWRNRRAGEAHALTPSVQPVSLDELTSQPLVHGYQEADVVYGFRRSTFPLRGVPVLTTVGLKGIDGLLTNNETLPHLLNVNITMDPSSIQTLEQRIIDRLILTEEFPVSFKPNTATLVQQTRIRELLDYTLQRITDFDERQKFYDATFINNTASSEDIRAWLYRERPEHTTPKDIALRINRFYRAWITKKMPPHQDIGSVHNQFITSLMGATVGYTLNPNAELLQQGIHGSEKQKAVKNYCRLVDVEKGYVNDTLRRTRIESVCKQDDGRIFVYLVPAGAKPISAQEIRHSQSSCDFHTLGFLSYVIEERFKVRPQFVTDGDVVTGIQYGLTDRLHPSLIKPREYYQISFIYR
ncbi:MAG: hypothetical protein WC254_01465 [Candidatus Woesearchaeota archaeon]|jgi:hypothetical protein